MDWREIPSLAALRAFEAAARLQSLSAAARELNVTHAAIAQHVRALEQEFGESLMVRQGRGVTPTVAGRTLAEGLAHGFQSIVETVQDMRRQEADRPLNITVTPTFAASWLMPRIGEFWSTHPEIVININPSPGVVDLRRDGFDLAVRYGEGPWPGLTSELLTEAGFAAVAHPDVIGDRKVRSLKDLTDLPWLLDDHVLERRRLFEREGIDLDKLKVTMLTTNSLVLSAAVAGLGVTFQPRSIVEREVRLGQLVRLCELSEENLGYHLVTMPGRVPAKLEVFLAWLRRKAREDNATREASATKEVSKA